MPCRPGRQAGVSLIEALVALAVMAFGMLGVVGMQTNLRSNADLSRQRAEAVRLAQEEIERVRNFSVLLTADITGSQQSFQAIAPVAAASVAASAVNTTFFRETLVATPTADDPLLRHVQVRVRWADRRASDAATPNQFVELSTMVAGIPPDLAALHAMRTDRAAMQLPQGRNVAVPRGAVDLGDGTSRFTPPGASPGVSWIFSNSSGLITRICTSVSPSSCATANRWLLTGRIAFATGGEPTATEAENPSDLALSVTVQVERPSGYLPSGSAITCTTALAGTTRLEYFCALPTTLLDPGAPGQRVWSGRVRFGGISLASSLSDDEPDKYKVCRYTPDERQFTAASEVTAAGESFSDYNARNPYSFLRVNGPQLNKNFLVISAGDGSSAYSCPDEDTATLIESNTWPQDPAS